jgi:site-specific DNA-methyltransferase (adenine-specific)
MNARMFMPSDERIYWIRKDDDFTFNDETEIKTWSSIWKFGAKNDIKVSAAFPFELPYRCILACSKEEDIIFDPFSGSGTTIAAASKTGRIGYGIELSPDHVKSSLMRFMVEGLRIKKVTQ